MTEFVVESIDGSCHYLNLDEMKYVRLPNGTSEYKPSGFISVLDLDNASVMPVVGKPLEIFINSGIENQTVSRNIGIVNAVFPCVGPVLSMVDVSLVA